MDEDFQSFIVDPDLVDQGIDVSRLKTQTSTRPELLFDLPEFSGIKVDPTKDRYIQDMYKAYGGELPMLPEPVVETPVVTTPIVDTSVMDQPAGDSVLDTTPTETFAGQPATSITPGATIDNVTGNITNPDGSFGGNIVDEVALTGAAPSGITGDPIDVGIPDNESGFVDPLGTIGGAPVISPVLTNQGPTIGTVDPTKAFADQTPITDVELAEQGFLPNISDVTPPGFEPTITAEDTPETFIDKAKDFLGLDNINLPEFAIKAAINKTVGQPITLAFDLAKNIFDRQTTQDQGVTADDAFDTTNEAATNVASINEADVEAGLATESIADIDPADDFEVSGDVANVGTTMDLIGPAPVDNIFDEVALTGDGEDSDPASAPAPAYDFDDPTPASAPVTGTTKPGTSGGGGPSGGGKSIVCTAMYQTTGLEDWKKAMKIWYIYQKKYLTIQHQEGYHKLFKPFVKGMHKNKIIKAIGAHIAKHRTQHLKHVMFNSKPSLLGKIYNKILEPICYWVGKHD